MRNKPFQHSTDRQRLARAGKNLPLPHPTVVSDKTRLARVGRPLRPVVPIRDFQRKTHFVLSVENQARHNVAELVLYEQCIRRTLAYTGRDGYSKSEDQKLYVRRPDVTTWNPGEVFAPASQLVLQYPQNLWNEFVDGTGPQNSVFLSEHPITSDLRLAMQDAVDRLLYLLYEKYHGHPGQGAEYVDLSLSFGAYHFIAALSNRNKTFAGSANMSGFVVGNRVLIVLADTKSVHSLALHATHLADHFRSTLSMYGFTYQFYIWSVGMKDYNWYRMRKKIAGGDGRRKDWFGINPTLQP